MPDHVEYRVAFVKDISGELLVTRLGNQFCLPRVAIPQYGRLAEELIRSAEQRWALKSSVIDVLTSGVKPGIAFLEVRKQERNAGGFELASVPVEEIAKTELSHDERIALDEILRGDIRTRGPFSRVGWMAEAQEWIKSNVKSHEIVFTEEVRQINAGAGFALVRFGTKQRPSYWLKAVGEPNTHEFVVTTSFAAAYPEYLPPLVCARDDWRAWVTEEFGHALQINLTFSELQRVIVFLAGMQIRLAGRSGQLLRFGCFDQRIGIIQQQLPEMVEYLQEVMELQTSTKVPRLPKSRLCELGAMLGDALLRMSGLEIPDSLVLSDISSDNILSDGRRCVVTDWCEAYLGNPFITLEYLVREVSRLVPHAPKWIPKLRALYRSHWLGRLSKQQIDRASALIPVIAVASYLYGRGEWRSEPNRSDPQFQSYSRSLARFMDRAAQDLRFREALCR